MSVYIGEGVEFYGTVVGESSSIFSSDNALADAFKAEESFFGNLSDAFNGSSDLEKQMNTFSEIKDSGFTHYAPYTKAEPVSF
jgi:CHAD domain-containing protein